MPLTAAHLRKLADELEAEEQEAERKLRETEDEKEKRELRERLEALEARERQVEEALKETEDQEEVEPQSLRVVDEPGKEPKKKTRPGRKRGQVYQDKPGEPGYVWDGDDEPDEVEIDDDQGAA